MIQGKGRDCHQHKNQTSHPHRQKEKPSNLWLAPMSSTPTNENHQQPITQAANVYSLRTKKDLAQYLHLTCWSPTPTTWKQAVELGFFATFPGLSPSLISKHLPRSIATSKGHLKQLRKNLRSTKSLNSTTDEAHIMTALDYPSGPNARTNLVTFKTVTEHEPTGAVATDQTGQFPICSSRGNQYLMVAYVRDANGILAVPIKTAASRP